MRTYSLQPILCRMLVALFIISAAAAASAEPQYAATIDETMLTAKNMSAVASRSQGDAHNSPIALKPVSIKMASGRSSSAAVSGLVARKVSSDTSALSSRLDSEVPGTAPLLPQSWVNNNECNGNYTYELQFPGTWIGVVPSNWPSILPYSTDQTGLQDALGDMDKYRTTSGKGTRLDTPQSTLYTGSSGIVIMQSATAQATECNVWTSTGDPNLTHGTTICTRGIQDNISESTDIGLDNPDCTGTQMSYTLAGVTTTIAPGSFTLANGQHVGTGAYNNVSHLTTIECSGTNCVPLSTCSPVASGALQCSGTIGPDHWLIEDLELRVQAGATGQADIVHMTGYQNLETSASQLPSHIHLRRIWAHGDWFPTATGLTNGRNRTSNPFAFGPIYGSILDSYASEFLSPGNENHCWFGGQGQQLKFDHNYCDGGSIGYISGGYTGAGPSLGIVPEQDVEVRRNRFKWPAAWLGVMKVPSSNTVWSNQSLVRKNMSEMKEGERWIIDGNIFENLDNSGGQNGTELVFNVRNSSVGTGTNYNSVISDITFSDNIVRNSCQGLEVAARSATATSNGGGVALPMQSIWFHDSLLYNVSVSNPGCSGVNSGGVSIGASLNQWSCSLARDSTGTVATATCASAPGLTQTDINIGDHIAVAGCIADTSFNTPTILVNGINVPKLGPLAISPTSPTTLTVVFDNTGTANASDTTGSCTVYNVQGWPKNLLWTHNTLITDASKNSLGSPNEPSPSNGSANYAADNWFAYNIWTGGGWANSSAAVPEGTSTEGFNWDSSTLSAFSEVFVGRTASKYTEYGNNPNYPDPVGSGCIASGCTPPLSIYFPANAACSGPPNSTCVGFSGGTTSLPLTFADYHSYSLLPNSVFAAGQSEEAADGTSMGPNFPAIDTAQTLITYPGGFSDN